MGLLNLFGKSKALQQEVETLKTALEECSGKLAEKQEHINTTNAYWKKKLKEQQMSGEKKPKAKKNSNGYNNPPLDA
jgi:hypothetical protein